MYYTNLPLRKVRSSDGYSPETENKHKSVPGKSAVIIIKAWCYSSRARACIYHTSSVTWADRNCKSCKSLATMAGISAAVFSDYRRKRIALDEDRRREKNSPKIARVYFTEITDYRLSGQEDDRFFFLSAVRAFCECCEYIPLCCSDDGNTRGA